MSMTHSLGNYLLARYYVETTGNIERVADRLATMETTGGWIFKTDPTERYASCKGKVHLIEEREKGKGFVLLLFPLSNLNLKEAAFTDLWLSMIGGAAFDMIDYSKSRLIDFALPSHALKYFVGPRFGIRGTRRLLGLAPGEPVIGTIIKPTAGLTPKEVADICYKAALGGVRFIKDDEKMMNPSYCSLAERVKQVTRRLREAEKKTGLEVLYAPHISAGPDKIRENAKTALKNGANALMLNFFGSGFGSLEIIARDKQFNVPIYAHCGGRSAMSRVEGQGVDPSVIAKFARLCGGDYFRTGTLGGYLVGSTEELKAISESLTAEVPGICDSVPVVSGGLNAANLAENLDFFGTDVLALAGSGLLAHPNGIIDGAKAFSQAAEAYVKKIPVEEYAETHSELEVALRLEKKA